MLLLLTKVPTSHILEKDFQLQVRGIAEGYGWEVWCTLNSKGSPFGEPDLRMCRPPRYLTVELKTDRGTLSADQKRARYLLEQCPQVDYWLWRPRDIELIHRVLRPDNEKTF